MSDRKRVNATPAAVDAADAPSALDRPDASSSAPVASSPEDGERPSASAPRLYLSHVRVDHFGAWSHRTIGPFSPGLNVVFGRNEAGKTTLASFVDGVLFGWETARKKRNVYKPDDSERAGALLFRDAAAYPSDLAAAVPLELARARNADGLQGDGSILEDIDRDTYRTIFSLTSQELLSLNEATGITARLLTAGSGTKESPASALASIDGRLAEFTSRASAAENSLVRLNDELDEAQSEMAAAAQEAHDFREQNQELRDLEPRCAQLDALISATSEKIELAASCRAGVEKIDAEVAALEETMCRARAEASRAAEALRDHRQACGERLAHISSAEDRVVCGRIEELAERETLQARAVDDARASSNESSACYAALRERLDDLHSSVNDAQARTRGRRSAASRAFPRARMRGALIAPCALVLLLIVVGVAMLAQGLGTQNFTGAACGAVMAVLGAAFGVYLLVCLLRMRGNAQQEQEGEQTSRLEEQLADARQRMVYDRKRLESCVADQEALASRIGSELADMGLAEAGASLRRARAILDDARDARAQMALDEQGRQTALRRVQEAQERLTDLTVQRARLCEQIGLAPAPGASASVELDLVAAAVQPASGKVAPAPAVGLADIDQEIARLDARRSELRAESDAAHRRCGELSQSLARAQHLHDFDRRKNRVQELRTRRDEAARDFARLLLARRMLAEAIDVWEAESQPEVYACASRLLALMTDGRWQRVDILPDGDFQVTDQALNTRLAHMLSTGTCQQLYLALRIALLMCADGVGRALPIIADDILVNFDAARRVGAARAVAELAHTRQVIMLTCHEEVVCMLEDADANAVVINL